jgi:hypothetical protein
MPHDAARRARAAGETPGTAGRTAAQTAGTAPGTAGQTAGTPG